MSGEGVIRMANCPFHGLLPDHRDLVCGMNLALAEGIIEGLGDARHVARLDPRPGMCCVAFDEAGAGPAPGGPPTGGAPAPTSGR
ncbi:MAG: hypothetical protein R3C32_00730 [Chloroflexota bacterium]